MFHFKLKKNVWSTRIAIFVSVFYIMGGGKGVHERHSVQPVYFWKFKIFTINLMYYKEWKSRDAFPIKSKTTNTFWVSQYYMWNDCNNNKITNTLLRKSWQFIGIKAKKCHTQKSNSIKSIRFTHSILTSSFFGLLFH